MRITTLQNIAIEELVNCYNLAFSDYILPVNMTTERMDIHIHSRHVKLKLSAGAFDNGKLIGFVLIGVDVMDGRKVSYNAGTGVIPDKRGNEMAKKMIDFVWKLLINEGIEENILEVIGENERALHIYRSLGYTTIRELVCYNGNIQIKEPELNYRIEHLGKYEWDVMKTFWDWAPSWQHHISASENLFSQNVSLGIYVNDCFSGYAIYNPEAKRMMQFAVNKNSRRKGIGKALFCYIAKKYSPELSVINVDSNSKETINFLDSLGLNYFIKQYEMKLTNFEINR